MSPISTESVQNQVGLRRVSTPSLPSRKSVPQSPASAVHSSSYETSSVPSSYDVTRRFAPPPMLMRSMSSSANLGSSTSSYLTSYTSTSSNSSSSSSSSSSSNSSTSSSPLLLDTAGLASSASRSTMDDVPPNRATSMDEPSAGELDRQLSLYREELRLQMAQVCRSMIPPQKF